MHGMASDNDQGRFSTSIHGGRGPGFTGPSTGCLRRFQRISDRRLFWREANPGGIGPAVAGRGQAGALGTQFLPAQ